MNKTFKKFVVALLSVLMIMAYMPAMAFADEELVLQGAYVTTDDTTEPIHYDTFGEALTATNNDLNDGKHPEITLLEDAALSAETYVRIPLTIKLNGHTLTETTANTFIPVKESWGGNYYGICRQDTDAEIIFADHEVSQGIYNWAKRENNDAWHVVGLEEVCDNCGFHEEAITRELSGENPREAGYQTTPTTPNATGATTYTFRERYRRYNQWTWRTLDTKTVEGPEAAKYRLSGTTQIVRVNGVNQHKDGLPVVKAGMVDSVGNEVEPTITVTAATKAELDATDPAVTVYAENGTTVVAKPYNADPTCIAMGKTTYKVVVSDPDGKAVETKYLQDSQAAAKTGHVKGALKGYKLLEKSDFVYDTEADAVKAGKDAGKSVVKVASKTTSGVTKYCYWAYSDLVVIEGTKISSTAVTITPAAKNLENNGSFTIMPVYFCNFEDTNEVDDAPVTVSPLDDATSAAEAADGKHSTCVKWAYAAKKITYTFGTGTVQSTFTSTLNFAQTNKTSKYYSHVSDGTMYQVTEQPTCTKKGSANIKCAICGDTVAVEIAKLPDTFGAYPGTGKPPISAFEIDGTPLSGTKHTITLNADRTEAVVTPTCTQPGGTFKYCTAGNHWVLQGEAVPATGHKLITVVSGSWDNTDAFKPDYDAEKDDYQYHGNMICSNPACDGSAVEGIYFVTFHSKAGTDTLTDKYSAIDINKEAKGKDCKTNAKTTYTVKDIKDRTGAAITTSVTGPDSTRGDHVLEVKNFNWSSDFEKATVTTKCTFKGCPEADKTFTKEAKVTKATDETGLTTYTATYGDVSESQKVYTLRGAKVTYDTSKITDGNLVKGVQGAAAQTPEVTVTLNGTVINSSELEEVWNYTGTTVSLYVTWAADKAFDDEATVMTGNANTRAYADEFHVAAKTRFSAPTYTVKQGKNTVTRTDKQYSGVYDANTKWSVAAATTVKGAAVKYAVTDTEAEDQKAIDALDYSLDKVDDIQNVGTYYVYAQLSKSGYTNYSVLAAEITISRKAVEAVVDNFTMKQGETPVYNMTILDDATGAVMDVDQSVFTVKSAGGKALEDLEPGEYRILVSADNYSVYTDFREGRVGTVTVLTKDGKDPKEEAEKKAEATKEAKEAIKEAAKIDDTYPEEEKAAVDEAKAALEALLADPNATADDIEEATEDLYDAIYDAEDAKAEEEAMEEALEDAADAIAAADKIDDTYPADAKAAVDEARGELEEIARTGSADEIEAAATKLQLAVLAAEIAKAQAEAEEAERQAAIDDASEAAAVAIAMALSGEFTDDSMEIVGAALEELVEVLADETSTTADIKNATKLLELTIDKAVAKLPNSVIVTDVKTTYNGEAVVMPTPQAAGTGAITFKYYADAEGKTELTAAPVNAGSYFYKACVAADANYKAAESRIAKLTVEKAASKINKVKPTKKTVKSAKKTTFQLKATTVGDGAVSFKKAKGDKKITVKKSGKVIVKKGLTAGKTYKVTVKVKVKATENYKAASKKVTVKVVVK